MNITDKIKITTMFSDEEKIQILEKLSLMNQSEIEAIEEGIDDYTESMISMHQQYKNEIMPKIIEAQNSQSEESKKWAEKTLAEIGEIDKIIQTYSGNP